MVLLIMLSPAYIAALLCLRAVAQRYRQAGPMAELASHWQQFFWSAPTATHARWKRILPTKKQHKTSSPQNAVGQVLRPAMAGLRLRTAFHHITHAFDKNKKAASAELQGMLEI